MEGEQKLVNAYLNKKAFKREIFGTIDSFKKPKEGYFCFSHR